MDQLQENSSNDLDKSKEKEFLQYSLKKIDPLLKEDVRVIPNDEQVGEFDPNVPPLSIGDEIQDFNGKIINDLVDKSNRHLTSEHNSEPSDYGLRIDSNLYHLEYLPKFETTASFRRKILEKSFQSTLHNMPGKLRANSHFRFIPSNFNKQDYLLSIFREELQHSGNKACVIKNKYRGKSHLMNHLASMNVYIHLIQFSQFNFSLERSHRTHTKNQN